MFTIIYRWFKSLYGGLSELLAGSTVDADGFSPETVAANQFTQIGSITLVIALVFMLLYYYVFNHPRFNRWWSWLIVLILTGITNLFIGFFWTVGYIETTEDIQGTIYQITQSECWGFGFANLIVSILWFIVFSLIFKWKSRNCKYSPF